MAYKIELSAGHPSGTMQREGVCVSYGKAAIVDEVPAAIRKDPWFKAAPINRTGAEKLIAAGAATDYRAPDKEKKTEKTAE